MAKFKLIFVTSTVLILLGAVPMSSLSYNDLPSGIRALVENGEFSQAQKEIKKFLEQESEQISAQQKERLLYEVERLDRIRKDFCLTRVQVFESLKKEIPDLKPGEFDLWDKAGLIDSRIIDGKRYYFDRCIRNLFRFCPEAQKRKIKDPTKEQEDQEHQEAVLNHIKKVIETAKAEGKPFVLPQRFRVKMTVAVKSGQAKPGETIRCWLPFPRKCPLHRDIKLISTSPSKYHLAPAEHLQRSIYFEQPAQADQSTTFSVEYEYTSYAFYQKIDPAKVKPYDINSAVYKENTAERRPHLTFTPELKQLVQKIVGQETNPYLKARKIFDWILENIRYESEVEYSTIENISHYCFLRKKGDCGVQGMLFIALCRIGGVPARWQSGWSTKPWYTGMHDWCQFYIEPYGWLYADPSRGLFEKSQNPEVRYFHFGNIDRYRLVANNDFSQPFDPPKKHFRSEPVDFQRGELETPTGNLYFDQWDYYMKATPIE